MSVLVDITRPLSSIWKRDVIPGFMHEDRPTFFFISFYCISSDCPDLAGMTCDFSFLNWLC